jgi:hypothetical protein
MMKKAMINKILFLSLFALGAILLVVNQSAALDIVDYGDLSPSTPASRQWEVSSAVLPSTLSTQLCSSIPNRQVDDPQIFLSWVDDMQRIMSCPLSLLGTPSCNAVQNTGFDLGRDFGVCSSSSNPIYVPKSNDNIMVRLQDGRLVQAVQTIKLNCPTQSPPACVGEEDREQVSYVVRVSDNCGQNWTPSVLDATEVRDLNGNLLNPLWRNFDRVEIYADPWSDHILLTSQPGPNQCCCSTETAFLHASTAGGVMTFNWQQLFKYSPASVPTVMTSLPHSAAISRVYWFNCQNWHPTLYFMDNPWYNTAGSPPQIKELDALLQQAEGGSVTDYQCSWTDQVGLPPNRTPIRNIIGNPSIARVDTDGSSDVVRVMYYQKKDIQGFDYNTIRVVDVQIPAGNPVTAKTKRIFDAASNPGGSPRASIFYPSIIQVDQITPLDPIAATHLLHWSEIRDDRTVVEKVVAWNPVDGWQPEAQLNSSPWTCLPPSLPAYNGDCTTGDYQYGAFIDTLGSCSHRFFVPYGVQEDYDGDQIPDTVKTHGAIVTTTTTNPVRVYPSEGLIFSGPAGGPFTPSQYYYLINQGSSPISWTAINSKLWLTLSPTSGTLVSDQIPVKVSINPFANGLASGTYSDTVSFTNATGCYETRPVTLRVKTPGVLEVMNAGGLKSSGPEGGPFSPSSKVYRLQNTGGWPISWTASQTFILHPWVTLSATSGTLEPNTHPTNVTVSINSNANSLPQEGSPYKDTVSFTNETNGNGNTTRVVNLTVTPPGILSVVPADALTSSGPEGGPFSPSSKAYTLKNTGGSSINWTTSKMQTWTSLSKTSGVLRAGEGTTVTVSINSNANSLPQEGSPYKDTVSFTNETNGNGNTTRVVYLTVNAPTVLLTIPNGGDVLPSGGTYAICWKTSSKAVKFDLLYTTNGTDWTAIKTVTGLSCIRWEVPVVTKNEKQCRVKVIGYDSNGVKIGEDTSDKPFTIEVLRITSPNGGEVLKSGSTWNIGWKSFETIRPVAKTVLKITTNPLGNRWNAIKKLPGNPGNYSWKVPNVSSKQCKVKVVLQDADGVNVGTDVSDKFFTIQP